MKYIITGLVLSLVSNVSWDEDGKTAPDFLNVDDPKKEYIFDIKQQ